MRKYRIHLSFSILIIIGLLNTPISSLSSPGFLSGLIAGISVGVLLIIICLIIACLSFLSNRGKAFWDIAFAVSILLIILGFLGQLATRCTII